MKKSHQFWGLVGFFLVYVLSTFFQIELLANILSPTLNIGIGLFVLSIYKDKSKDLHISWFTLGLMVLSWGLCDAIWLIYENIIGLDANESTLLMVAYGIPNVMLMITAIQYFWTNIKKRNRLQLALDMSFIFVMIFLVVSEVFLESFSIDYLSIEHFFSLFLYIITDTITTIIMVTMLFSAKIYKISKSFLLIITSVFIYVLIDFAYTYQYVMDVYIPNQFTDVVYQIALLIIGVAIVLEHYGIAGTTELSYEDFRQNHAKRIVAGLFMVITVLLLNVGIIQLKSFAVLCVLLVIYQYANKQVQIARLNEIYLNKEKVINSELEDKVELRTRALREAYDKLKYQASHDSLTELYNRNYLMDYIRVLIAERSDPFAILYMDLDRFKIINDIHGHAMGDLVLKEVSKRFQLITEKVSLLGRVGGDEFAVICDDCEYDSLVLLSEAIITALKEPIIISNYQFSIGVSIGISRYPKDAHDIDELLRYADLAMYHAKSNFQQQKYMLYTSHLIEHLERRNTIELLLRNTPYDEAFEIYYQPQFDIKTKKIIGMEALLRWKHPVYGYIPPSEFIPIAEEIGLIIDLSNWIFQNVFKQIHTWNTQLSQPLVVGINVSPLTLDYVDFYPLLNEWLVTYDINPEWIDLEITEHSAMNSSVIMEEIFTTLSGMGFNISIDDFGTGYSSLSYIKQFNVDRLKIAKELIDQITTDHNERLIVNAIIKMAEGLGLKTIAEGVETFEQLEILAGLSCDQIQGYVLGKPMPAKDFENLYVKYKKF